MTNHKHLASAAAAMAAFLVALASTLASAPSAHAVAAYKSVKFDIYAGRCTVRAYTPVHEGGSIVARGYISCRTSESVLEINDESLHVRLYRNGAPVLRVDRFAPPKFYIDTINARPTIGCVNGSYRTRVRGYDERVSVVIWSPTVRITTCGAS